MARKSTGKRLRFEVFKRDEFTCQYCGAHPPAVVLVVDHINPVAAGGDTEINNLITACEPCNQGKSDRPLTSVPMPLADKMEDLAEREAQIEGYREIMDARAARLEDDSWRVADALTPGSSATGFDRRQFASIKRFVDAIGLHATLDAAEIAYAHVTRSDYQRFRYFCGVCWNRIRRGDDARP